MGVGVDMLAFYIACKFFQLVFEYGEGATSESVGHMPPLPNVEPPPCVGH